MQFIKNNEKFIKFLFVGGLNTIFGYSVFALLIFMGLYLSFVVIIATILGILLISRQQERLFLIIQKTIFYLNL